MLKTAVGTVLGLALFGWNLASADQLEQDVPLDQLPQAIPLNMLWRISFGTDYATTAVASERDAHAPSGVLYYVPSTGEDSGLVALPGVTTLYRLLNSSGTDHMDSLTAGEGGYLTEGPLGYPWTSQTAQPGLAPITRIYDDQPGNNWTGDHALMVAADALHTGESFPYYHVEGPVGYGYARYVSSDVDLRSTSSGNVTVLSNVATGGSVWEWWWYGIQFIDDYDYGRQLSAALYPYLPDPVTGEYVQTKAALQETGDHHSDPGTEVIARHSSPCLYYSSSGTSQSTLAIPLDWEPANWGGDIDHPVIYPNVTMGKNLTLDWIGPDNVDRQWPVALYETVINGVSLTRAVVEAPTAYLNQQFNTYYSYDPVAQSLQQIPLSADQSTNLPAGPMALIITDGSSVAMGVYKNDPNAGMVVENNTQAAVGPYSKWSVHYDSGIQPTWSFRTWIVTDTLQNVINDIQQLYAFGVTSRD